MWGRKFNIGDRVKLLTVRGSLEFISEFFHVGELGTVVGYDDTDIYDYEDDYEDDEDDLGVLVLFDGHEIDVVLSEYEIKKVGE